MLIVKFVFFKDANIHEGAYKTSTCTCTCRFYCLHNFMHILGVRCP